MDFTGLDDKDTDLDNPVFSGGTAKCIDLGSPEHTDDGFDEQDFANKVAASVNHNASDLHLCTGYHPVLRIDGALKTFMHWPRVSANWLNKFCRHLLSEEQHRRLWQMGQVDCAYTTVTGQRLRANIFQQQRGQSVAFRIISAACPSLEELDVPPIIHQLIEQENGLILVTGATGSGKSTTLSAMISAINQHQARHIITLEDPIEFVHSSLSCLIQQRELGSHTPSFSHALTGALRQDPDIILLGELRDLDTIRLALTAAETGHLVLATLHTRTATQAIDRLVDVFPAAEKATIQAQLAASLRAVIAQKLCHKVGGGRIAVFEILTQTTAVSHLIREGKTYQLANVIQTGAQWGMQTFEQGMAQREEQGVLAEHHISQLR
ncbi:twitching motility protein PilT [Yersinia intermedia]|uniref:type IV pilus twitching motility protein PilT n=1 Tax=Yersinia intermedia TaxID=631 RepID=UPI0005E19CFF|nr:type IV pilus twitching motility protein PilT [Yersinia intermedia]MCB5323698.1 type IV pilus twitching motility protein PilT [Yersinia intermedia]UZM71749.1 type IV pilus twitching motility protein PilT [Yersinia intermedia]CNC99975.1 twitching motility protein PilT [Yersinia intermedia]CNH14261.1 twitching motility protein PilT [Yersinia intermedia]